MLSTFVEPLSDFLGKALFQAFYLVLSVSHAHFSCMVHYSLERKVANCFLNGLPPIKALLARHSPGKCQTMKPVTGMLRSEVAGAARPRGRGSVQNRCLRVHYLPKASVLEIMKLTVVLFNITD